MSKDFSKHRSLLGELDPARIHIILLKLMYLFDNIPDLTGFAIDGHSQRQKWLSEAGALLKKYDRFGFGVKFDTTMSLSDYITAVRVVHGYISDAIETIKLDLELDGRSEIGTTYSPGEVYRYYADLKNIIAGATREIFLIDPYFDGTTFDAYLSNSPKNVSIRILAGYYSKDIPEYAKRHSNEFTTQIEVRKSSELHDRLVILDQDACWISGQSIKDAGTKTTYLIPLDTSLAKEKYRIYEQFWIEAETIYKS